MRRRRSPPSGDERRCAWCRERERHGAGGRGDPIIRLNEMSEISRGDVCEEDGLKPGGKGWEERSIERARKSRGADGGGRTPSGVRVGKLR